MSNLRERLVAAIHPAKMECGIDAEAVRRVMEAILPIIESELQSACALVLERAAVICKAKAVYANRSAHGKDDLFKGLLRELENILYDTAKNISELIRNYAQIIAEHDAQVRAEYAERHAEAHRQQVLLLMGDKDKLKVERDRAESALAEAQKLIRKLRDAMEDIRSFAPSNQRYPAARIRLAEALKAATALLEGAKE